MVSTAMTLLDGLRTEVEARFGCPVIDIYGMNEAGPIAAALPAGGHVLLQPRLYVELLGGDGRPVPVGERGEITLTGGFNPALPLLRYRTGDHASFAPDSDLPVLLGLEGRPPVPLVSADGRAVNTIDVTVALRHLTAGRYTLHQRADRSLSLGLDETGRAAEPAFVTALADLFAGVPVDVHPIDAHPETVTYTSDL
jgi:phenylacetate-CoA ligase